MVETINLVIEFDNLDTAPTEIILIKKFGNVKHKYTYRIFDSEVIK